MIHRSTIKGAILRNYTLINPINSLVDNSLRRQNFCIFDLGRRIPRMLHKSFPATLSNSTDAHTFPYPLSLSLSLSSFLLASCCTRQQLHASLANRRGPSLRATIDPVQISNRMCFEIAGGEKSLSSKIYRDICDDEQFMNQRDLASFHVSIRQIGVYKN